MTTIDVRGVSRWHGDKLAVDNVSLLVPDGTITGVLGPNGSGKTSLLRRMLGIDAGPGTTLFGGLPYSALPRPLAAVGVVLDVTGAHPGIRARRHLGAIAAAHDVPRSRISEVLEFVGIGEARDIRTRALSLGMRQRLAIAAALICSPTTLILDEPTNGLDPHGVRWLGTFLRGFADDGGAVLVSSHMVAEIEQIADRVEVMSCGRLVASGPASDVARSTAPTIFAVQTTEPEALAAELMVRGATVDRGNDELRVSGLDLAELASIAKAAPGLVLGLREDTPSLESAYLTIATAR
jgi:ABC-2 type transport system ATP-binding protein